jgi:hypothetical protein
VTRFSPSLCCIYPTCYQVSGKTRLYVLLPASHPAMRNIAGTHIPLLPPPTILTTTHALPQPDSRQTSPAILAIGLDCHRRNLTTMLVRSFWTSQILVTHWHHCCHHTRALMITQNHSPPPCADDSPEILDFPSSHPLSECGDSRHPDQSPEHQNEWSSWIHDQDHDHPGSVI